MARTPKIQPPRAPGYTATSYTISLKKDALKGARLGVLRRIFTDEASDARIITYLQTTLAELKAAGAEIVDPFVVPELDSLPRPIVNPPARFKNDLTKWIAKHPGMPYPSIETMVESKLLHPLHQPVFELAAASKPVDDHPVTAEAARDEQRYRKCLHQGDECRKNRRRGFSLLGASSPIKGDRNTQLAVKPKTGPNAGLTAYTGGQAIVGVGSALQWPALSVPSGYLGEGLPQGLQILGRAWDEAKIIGYAYAYEQATHYRRPPPAVPRLVNAEGATHPAR